MSIQPIPTGYHSLQPYLIVRGAAKAMEFYKRLFGATEMVRMEMPNSDTNMHAELRLGDSVLMLADESDAWKVYSPQKLGGSPVTLMHYVKDVDAIYAAAISAGCTGVVPPTDMFWGDRFSKFIDPFGHVWSVATHKFEPTPEQIAEGAKAMCGSG